MRMTLLTPEEEFELFFYIKLSFIPQEKIIVRLKLNAELGKKTLEKTLMPGRPHSLLFRTTNFVSRVPKDILGRKKRKILPYLGKFEILVNKQKIYTEELPPIRIIDNHIHFETETVPETLEALGFCVTVIGGKNEPDLIAYHLQINPQKIDVEPTLSATYGLSDLDNDRGKFGRYIKKYNFKRMLAVCQSKKISEDVIEDLNKTSDPIGLIEFKDLYSIRQKSKTKSEQHKAYTLLTSSGKITAPYPPNEPVLFQPVRFRVERQI